MIFWDIGRLTTQLRQGPLEQRAALRYMLVVLVLWTVPLTSAGPWLPGDWATLVITLGALVIGTLLAYRANGGQGGTDFVARYFALNWVVGIRTLVLVGLPLIVALLAITGWQAARATNQQAVDAESAWIGAGLTLCVEVIFYWRLIHFFRVVAS